MVDDVDDRIEEIWKSEQVTASDRIWGALAYIFSPLVPLIVLAVKDLRSRPFIKEHAVQGLILGVLFILVTTLTAYLCLGLIWLIMIYWGWRAYQAQPVNIPLITPIIRSRGWV